MSPALSKETKPMLAYHSDPALKQRILDQLAQHRAADEIVKGQYWEGGKGCAVGCTIYSSNHAEYERRFGIPEALARLEDQIFEGLPNSDAKLWPERFMGAIRPGSDLSRVHWHFLHWLLTVELAPITQAHPDIRAVVLRCAAVLGAPMRGEPIDKDEARAAAAEAAAAWAAARAARAAAAEAAVWAVWAAAAEAAEAAAEAAAAAEASYKRQADRLIHLLEARCETCPWIHQRRVFFVSPRDGLLHQRNGLFCKRFPDEIEKDAGDWCGEHPAFAALRNEKE